MGIQQTDQSQREGGRCREGKLNSQKTRLQFSCLLHDLGWLSSQSGKSTEESTVSALELPVLGRTRDHERGSRHRQKGGG